MDLLKSLVVLWLLASVPMVLQAEEAVDIASLQSKAEAGDAVAQLNLGAAYDNGIGVERDLQKALQWYEKAAEQGLAEAQFNLAHLLVEQEMSASVAAEWMRKAAEQGMVDAQYLMGVIYAEGIGVEIDRKRARVWLNKAIAGGHEEAKGFLKEMEKLPPY